MNHIESLHAGCVQKKQLVLDHGMLHIHGLRLLDQHRYQSTFTHYSSTFKRKQGLDGGTQGLVKTRTATRSKMLQWKCKTISNQALPRKEPRYNSTSGSTNMHFITARPGWSTSIPWRCWCHCWRLPPWTCSSSQITKQNSRLQGTSHTKWRTLGICTPHQGEPLEENRLQGCRYPINPSDRFR